MGGELRIILELELDGPGDAICGRLSHGSGWDMPFVGWLGLAAAIEQAMTAGLDTARKMGGDPP